VFLTRNHPRPWLHMSWESYRIISGTSRWASTCQNFFHAWMIRQATYPKQWSKLWTRLTKTDDICSLFHVRYRKSSWWPGYPGQVRYRREHYVLDISPWVDDIMAVKLHISQVKLQHTSMPQNSSVHPHFVKYRIPLPYIPAHTHFPSVWLKQKPF